MNGVYNCFIYLHYFTISVHTATNLQMQGLCNPCTPPSQRSSTSDSLACTSTATSIGDPGSCGGWTSQGAAISCGVRIQPWVIEGKMFLLFHGQPPVLRSSSPTWFWLSFLFTLLELCICRQWFRVCFFLFLSFLMFLFLL